VTTDAARPDTAPRRAPQRWESPRLLLTPPAPADARDIFARYASDEDVTRYLSWPRHRTVSDSEAFVQFSLDEWSRRPAGPYLIRDRGDGRLIVGTGLEVDDDARAMTGYVLAREVWGRGYATEALTAMVQIAAVMGLEELFALCGDPDSTLATVLSLIPPFTPLLMMLRIAVKTPPAWQIAAGYLLTTAFVWGMVAFCARIYRVGILMYGKRPTFRELARWLRYS
jgi:RimJ/RimL family protein N-acetyltransferase